MPVYRPWTFANRQVVRERDRKAFSNNAAVYEEQNPVAPARVNPLDQVRSGPSQPPLAEGRKKGGGGLFGKLKDVAGDIAGGALDVGKDAGGKALTALDFAGDNTLRPLFGVLSGATEAERIPIRDAAGNPTGKFYRDVTNTGQGRSRGRAAIRDALTQNPLDTFREGKQAYKEMTADPEMSAGARVVIGAATDPLTYVGPGAVKVALRAAPAAVQASRAARVAGAVLESPRAASIGGVVGAAGAAEAADRADLSPGWQTAATLAGGVVGGVAGGTGAAKRALKVPGSLEPLGATVSVENPGYATYIEKMANRGVDARIGADGTIHVADRRAALTTAKQLERDGMTVLEGTKLEGGETSDWGGFNFGSPERERAITAKKIEHNARSIETGGAGADKAHSVTFPKVDPEAISMIDDAERIREIVNIGKVDPAKEALRTPFEPGHVIADPLLDHERTILETASADRSKGHATAGKEAAKILGEDDAVVFVNDLMAQGVNPRGIRGAIVTEIDRRGFFLDEGRANDGKHLMERAYRAKLRTLSEELDAKGHEAARPPLADAVDGLPPGDAVPAGADSGAAPATVKRVGLDGSVTDTFQTEAELAGIRATQGGMDLGGADAAKRAGIEGATNPAEVRPGMGNTRPSPAVGLSIETTTGRKIPRPPGIRGGGATDRGAINDIRKQQAWLQEQALAEAAARGDEFNASSFNNATPGKFPPATVSSMNHYLFGETHPEWDAAGNRIGQPSGNPGELPTVRENRTVQPTSPVEQPAPDMAAVDVTRAPGEGRPTGGVGGDVGQGDMIPPRAPGGTPPISGAPQAPLGQQGPGVDLIGGQARDTLMAASAKSLASPTGRILQNARRMMARLGAEKLDPNIVHDPRFTPVWTENNRIANVRSSMKAGSEYLWGEAEHAGLKLEQQPDGNWLVAGTNQHLGDVVERATPEAAAVWDGFSPEVKSALTTMTTLMDEARQTVEKYGGDMPLIDVEGQYFPRRVAAIAGQEKTTGVDTSRRQGAKQNFQKARTESDMANAANTDRVTYAHPLDAFTSGIDQKLAAAQDAYIKGLLKPLAVPDAKGGFGGLTDIPGVGVLNEAEARRANAGLTPRGPGNALEKMIGGVNQALTPIRASWDASGLGQQGQRRWLTDPVGAAKAWKTTVQSLKDPTVMQAALREREAAGPGIQYLAQHNLRITAEGAANEVTRLEISGPTRAAGNKLKGAYDTGMRVSAQLYDRPLNLHRIDAANDLWARLKAKGLEGAALDAEMDKGNLGINRMYGWSANRPASIESAAMFAPRYFRAQVESIVKAVEGTVKLGHAPIDAAMARNHLALLATEGMAAVYLINTARGKETTFDPRDSNFGRIRDVAGLDISPFGSYGTLFRALAGTIGGDSDGPVHPDITKLLRVAYNKASPALKVIIETGITKSTFSGKPLDPLGNPLGYAWEEAKSSVPFGVQNLIEGAETGKPIDALKGGLIGSVGIASNPVTPTEKRNALQDKLAQKQFGGTYASLPGAQKAVINEDAGVRKFQAEADSNTLTRADDRSKSTKVTQDAAKKIDALSAGLEAGQLTGPEWRKQYQSIQAELRGARDVLTINGKKDAALEGWYALYDKAEGEDGRLNYDLLDNLQADYRAKNPGIDAKVDQVTGAHDNATMREYRQASQLANEYYAIPAYRGMSAADGQKAGMVLAAASDMVAFGQARDKDAALRKIATIDPGGVQLAKVASRRGSNPARAKFRKDPANAVYAKFYSDAPVVTASDPQA